MECGRSFSKKRGGRQEEFLILRFSFGGTK
jgi:hypothetical protein